ncbi:MAG: T9SS type A sorting domain-containing protein [Chitinophagaceae bacterium]|nr:T9SS type A sorting domain-containing protein [Chitinophagaceae bacterium]
MKQFILLFSFFVLMGTQGKAENFNITISGFSYSPATLTVNVGDVVNIEASGFHSLVQISQASYDANDNTLLSGGFSSTSNFNLTITAAMAGTSIYYACSNHGTGGMKGRINVNVVANITENRAREFNFTAYPNPVVSKAWINISVKKAGIVSLSVYDQSGKIVSCVAERNLQPGEITLPFDASGLQKGTYILQMKTSQGIIRKRILIQ